MYNEILLFLMIRQADIFVDGHGTSEKDDDLIRDALFKLFKEAGVTTDSPDEVLEKMEMELEENKKLLAIEYREKVMKFMEEENAEEVDLL